MYLATKPSKLATISATARWYAAMTSRRSSGSSRDDSLVEADQVAKHYCELPAFGISGCRSIAVCGRRGGVLLGSECDDGIEQAPAVPHQGDAEIFQVLGGQAPQYSRVDLVRAERVLVLLQPETVEPLRNVHVPLPASVTPVNLPYRGLCPRE
jgi:hypothetical protein